MLRKRRKRHSLFLSACLIAVLLLCCSVVSAQNVREQYRKYFVKYTDKRSIAEKVFNLAGVTNADVGRSFALLCGISEYPNMSSVYGNLTPAAEDIRKLQWYLQGNEFFDEIVVLKNEQVTTANLEYFLQVYFADRLKKFPKSRFLFAYSGHGMTQNQNGYLLKSTARHLHDRQRSIKVAVLKDYIDEVVLTGHHVLALLNSCYSGTFLRRSFGKNRLFPEYPGAHAITAGGSNEPAWHDGKLGLGSVFYETILAGLHGKADRGTGGNKPDGIVTAHELGSYLINEIRLFTEQRQNPQMGDISQHGSRGEFFFLNRDTPLVQQQGVTTSGGTAMGGSVQDGRVGQYINHGDGTITDTKTGLMWKRCSEGLFGDNCEDGKTEKYTWDDAVKRFKYVSYADYADWRLPTIDELGTLVYCSNGTSQQDALYGTPKGCWNRVANPTINQQAFPNTEAIGFWSGSPDPKVLIHLKFAWLVTFGPGYSLTNARSNFFAVRLVRSGQ